ncbi:RNA 2',3'-cyclic phosphodiesterase [Sporosarcina cyprini]|uniref:RNA 2',3'-cyclic phosphodiesterase n=1 Tax=Sporosarcina cyprini TaxID=2910523 RepID=UPI001EDD67F7|nr:RNA 2',3'-cyclic phosphodiesterase [Sporosarcina cyprini]MCG3089506.1 RNA 2',3'-cyclic phosphodiesterase [Sporosarcina cyprini]
MSAHYFIGIKAPAAIRPIAASFQTQLDLLDTYKVLPHEEDLHMTLLFIGALPNSHITPLKKILSSLSVQHEKFQLEINHLAYFGSPKGPRVVYLGTDDSAPLSSLQQVIYSQCQNITGRTDANRFTPHITIAKKIKPAAGKPIVKEEFTGVPFQVDGFSLFTIHPEQSPKYEEIGYFELTT